MTENVEILTNPPVTLSRHRVVVLAYDGLCTFEFGIAVEIFGLPRPEMGERWYQFAVAAVDDGELRATGGIRLMTDGGMNLLQDAQTIVVPGWRGIDAPVPAALCDALAAAHARGCRIISICSGVFVLAAAGLLNGRRATTHWRYTENLRQRFAPVHHRHVEIQKHNVGPGLRHQLHAAEAVGGFADHFEIVLTREQRFDTAAKEGVVVD